MMTNLHTTNVRWTWTDVSMTVVTKTNERETVATWMNLSMTVDIKTSFIRTAFFWTNLPMQMLY